MKKFIPLTAEIATYIDNHHSGSQQDQLLQELRDETEALGEISIMQIGAEQGTFLSLLVAATGARNIVEVGSFTGYSSMRMAAALPKDGHLWCFDVSDEWTSMARRYWKRGGLEDRITLTLGDAAESLRQWQPPTPIDFAFIDADKPGYDTYYEALLPHVRDNGLIAFDNMLRDGRVISPTDENDRALDALNTKLASDGRVEAVLLSVADGIMLCRKKTMNT